MPDEVRTPSREICLGCPRRGYGHALGVCPRRHALGNDLQTNASTLALRRDVDAMLGSKLRCIACAACLCLGDRPMHWGQRASVGSVIKAPRVDLWRWASGGPPAGTPLGPPRGPGAPPGKFSGKFPRGPGRGGAPPGPPRDPPGTPSGTPLGTPFWAPLGRPYIYIRLLLSPPYGGPGGCTLRPPRGPPRGGCPGGGKKVHIFLGI